MEKTMRQETRAGDRVKTLVLTAVVAAMACAATLAVQIPSPTGGYLNLGDAVVLLGAYLLGPGYGAAAGAIGRRWRIWMTYPAYVPGHASHQGCDGTCCRCTVQTAAPAWLGRAGVRRCG